MPTDPRVEAVYQVLMEDCAAAGPAFGDGECSFCRENAEKAVAAADAAAEAAGWKLVPVEPTKEMVEVAPCKTLGHSRETGYFEEISGWRHILAAAPKIGGDDE